MLRTHESKQSLESKSGTFLVANVNSGTVTLINPDNLEGISLKVGKMPHEVEVSPNGKYALVSNYGGVTGMSPGDTLTLIDVENQKVTNTIQLEKGSRPHGICFMSDQQALVTTQGTNALLLLQFNNESKTFEVAHKFELPVTGGHMVTVDAEKTFAYVGCFSGNVCKVHLNFPFEVSTLNLGAHAEGVALTPDGKKLLATKPTSSKVDVIDTTTMTVLNSIPTGKWPSRAIIYNDGKSALIVNTLSGTIASLNLETMRVDKTFNTEEATHLRKDGVCAKINAILPVPINVVIQEDRFAYVTNLYTSHVARIDLMTGKIENLIVRKAMGIKSSDDLFNSPDGIAFSKIPYGLFQNKNHDQSSKMVHSQDELRSKVATLT